MASVTKNYRYNMNLDTYQLPVFTVKKWAYLTPSRFTAARSCAWREVLATSVGRQLLPTSPTTWLGTLIHSLIENIVNGTITNEADFDVAWRENVRHKEAALSAEGRHGWLPLNTSVPYFALKKLQTKDFLKNYKPENKPTWTDNCGRMRQNTIEKNNTTIFEEDIPMASPKFRTEKKLAAHEGWLVGKTDLIIETPNHIEIIDYKTGRIFDETNVLKEDYRTQLLLYSWLYADVNGGKYPNQLTIFDLHKVAHDIKFTAADCEKCAAEARCKFDKINDTIDSQQFKELAVPNEENCTSCSMRPVCVFKSNQLTQNWVDTEGIIENIEVARNEKTMRLAVFQNDGLTKFIHAIPTILQPVFEGRIGEKVGFFNLQKEKSMDFFKWHRQSEIFLFLDIT